MHRPIDLTSNQVTELHRHRQIGQDQITGSRSPIVVLQTGKSILLFSALFGYCVGLLA